MSYSITQFGKSLDESKYVIDEENKTFKTREDYLVLDFAGSSDWSFKTNFHCIIYAGSNCTFETDSYCTFITGNDCVFKTGLNCNFNTLWNCTFDTENNCTFNMWNNFIKIKTEGNSTVLIRDKKIHTYLEEEVELYFNRENDEILYTKEKWDKDKYLMMGELRR